MAIKIGRIGCCRYQKRSLWLPRWQEKEIVDIKKGKEPVATKMVVVVDCRHQEVRRSLWSPR